MKEQPERDRDGGRRSSSLGRGSQSERNSLLNGYAQRDLTVRTRGSWSDQPLWIVVQNLTLNSRSYILSSLCQSGSKILNHFRDKKTKWSECWSTNKMITEPDTQLKRITRQGWIALSKNRESLSFATSKDDSGLSTDHLLCLAYIYPQQFTKKEMNK